jgi:hypothetical protein
MSGPFQEAATWKTGLQGGFGFVAMMDVVFLATKWTAVSGGESFHRFSSSLY